MKHDSPGVMGLSGPTMSVVVVVGGTVVVVVGLVVVGAGFGVEAFVVSDDLGGAVVVGDGEDVSPFFMNTTVT